MVWAMGEDGVGGDNWLGLGVREEVRGEARGLGLGRKWCRQGRGDATIQRIRLDRIGRARSYVKG